MRIRPRRNRKSEAVREMVQETRLHVSDLMYPLFLLEDDKGKIEVESMPGIYRLGIETLLAEIDNAVKLGITSFDIFPVVEEHYKDKTATRSTDPNFFYLGSNSSNQK